MYDEIARVIDELQAGQKSVTENAVRKILKRKWNDKNFKKAYKEIRLKNSN
jgi:disulfide oxidoreductase YuzD